MKIGMAVLMLFLLPVMACSDADSPVVDSKNLLPECPGTPNCVSSLAADPGKRVEPFPVFNDPHRSMTLIADILTSLPRATVVHADSGRIEAEFRSLLGFVDDVLFIASAEGEVIHVRSASRSGKWDMGVNRRRVERLRKEYLRKLE